MNATKPTLFAAAATVQAIQRARAVVVLVGGYDGSGNYGDIVQLGAALDLADRLGTGVLTLPILEREYLPGHRQLAEESGVDPPLTLFFDPGGNLEDDLLPVAAPVELAFGAIYLYGGGYLNRLWGKRKLAMLDAAEALLVDGGAAATCRLSSGLQVEPEWLASGSCPALLHFDVLGARDGGSLNALAALGAEASARETGDDAVGPLSRLPSPNTPASSDARLHLNVHFAKHDWVSDEPQAVLGFYTGVIAELGRLAGRPVTIQPLIAYLDRRIDEREAVERLDDACSVLGAEVVEPLILRPASLAAAAPRLREAQITLSCSYHVALTSLMLEVPAVLIGDNPYYRQKAAGLAEDFRLPPTFAACSTADPVAKAREIAAVLFDDDRAKELRDGLIAGANRLAKRRADVEAEMLARLAGAAVVALSDRVEEQAQRLYERSTEPAELQTRLAAMHTELEELRRALGEPPVEAELRAQEAEARSAEAQEALTAILRSRSWRLAAPLRRFGALLRLTESNPDA